MEKRPMQSAGSDVLVAHPARELNDEMKREGVE